MSVIKAEGIEAKATEIAPKLFLNKDKNKKKDIKEIIENIICILKCPKEFKNTEYTFPILVIRNIEKNIIAEL